MTGILQLEVTRSNLFQEVMVDILVESAHLKQCQKKHTGDAILLPAQKSLSRFKALDIFRVMIFTSGPHLSLKVGK